MIRRDIPYTAENNPHAMEYNHEAPPQTRMKIANILATAYGIHINENDHLLRMNANLADCIRGHYFLALSSGESWHIDIRSGADKAGIELACQIAHELSLDGIHVPTYRKTKEGRYTKSDPEDFLFRVSPHISHHAIRPMKTDYLLLAQDLSRFHNSCRALSLSIQSQIHDRFISTRRQAAAARDFLIDSLAHNGEGALELRSWVCRNRSFLESVAAEYDPLLPAQHPSQPIHGDLHPGNLGISGDSILFFDLEAMTESFLSPHFDLAKASIRLMLQAKHDLCLGDFLHAYGIMTTEVSLSRYEVNRIWKQHAYDNIVRAIFACHQRRYLVAEDELDKHCRFASMPSLSV